MGHKRGFGFYGIVVCVVIAVALFGYLLFSSQSSLAANATSITGKPTTPPTGAASLNMDTCGCPSSGDDAPVCKTQRTWNVAKVSTGATEFEDLTEYKWASYNVTVSAHDSIVVDGSYDLIVTNGGVPTTYLTSVVVSLEVSAPNLGNAVGPSGKNWKVVSTATISAGNSQCNSKVPTMARICDEKGNATVRGTPGSNIAVLNINGTAIAGLETVPIPQTIADVDGDGNVNDSGDGVGCGNGILGVDDDLDGLFDEDGLCTAAARFKVLYSLALTPLQQTTLIGKSVRIHVASTFLTTGDRGGTCQADVDCDDVLSASEKNVRTVHGRQSFIFPSACPLECGCVDFVDTPAIAYVDPSSSVYQDLGYDWSGNGSLTTTVCGNFSLVLNTSNTCPEYSAEGSYLSLRNRADIKPATVQSDTCKSIFGSSLLLQDYAEPPAITSQCPAADVVPSPVSSPSAAPVDQLPPVGAVCTYSAGSFSQGTCNPAATTAVCDDRRNPGNASPRCLLKLCTDRLAPTGEFWLTPPFFGGRYNYRGFRNTNPVILGDMLAGFIRDNTGTPYYFTDSYIYTMPLQDFEYTTSARNLARQLTTALINRALVYQLDNSTQIEMFNALVFSQECSVVPAVFRGVELARLIGFAGCAIGLPYSTPLMGTPLVAIDYCDRTCGGVYSNLCQSVFSVYTQAGGFVNGASLADHLTEAMALYNINFPGCGPAQTDCIVLPASFFSQKRSTLAIEHMKKKPVVRPVSA